MKTGMTEEVRLLETLKGRKLSSVEFVEDYVQLRFDGATLTAVTQPSVKTSGNVLGWGAAGFKDSLCSLIRANVVAAEIAEAQELCIRFDNGVTVEVSLRNEQYRADEAVVFSSADGETFVL